MPTVFQSDSLFNNLNIAENVFANREIKTKMGIVDWRAIYQKTEEALKYLDIEVSANTPVSKLTVAERKMVEIARALISGAKIVVMDEPTTVFADSETEKMYEVIRHLKQANVALIYISHRLREIPKIADEITILREGESIATIDKKEFEKINIFEVMIGSKVKDRFPKIHVDIKEEVLIVNEIKNQYLKDITFSVRKGEILGIAGLKGSGRTSLARVLFGLDHIDKGAIYIEGEKIRSSDTESASELGISFIPANRFDKGLLQNASVEDNIVITDLQQLSNNSVIISNKKKRKAVNEYIEMLEIRCNDIREKVQNLSGGNQKKVMLAKWIFKNTRLIILNEPTSSMDIAAKVDIYNIINDLITKGVGVIFISSEIPELIGMCDRIMVMKNSQIVKTFERKEFTQEKILEAAL